MHIIESPGINNDRNRQVCFLPTTPITQFAFLIWLTLHKKISSHSIYNGKIILPVYNVITLLHVSNQVV